MIPHKTPAGDRHQAAVVGGQGQGIDGDGPPRCIHLYSVDFEPTGTRVGEPVAELTGHIVPVRPEVDEGLLYLDDWWRQHAESFDDDLQGCHPKVKTDDGDECPFLRGGEGDISIRSHAASHRQFVSGNGKPSVPCVEGRHGQSGVDAAFATCRTSVEVSPMTISPKSSVSATTVKSSASGSGSMAVPVIDNSEQLPATKIYIERARDGTHACWRQGD